MKQTKGAIGNLLNRYRAVLKKCHLLNTFGSLAVAGLLVMGGAGVAGAEEYGTADTPRTTSIKYAGTDITHTGDVYLKTSGVGVNLVETSDTPGNINLGSENSVIDIRSELTAVQIYDHQDIGHDNKSQINITGKTVYIEAVNETGWTCGIYAGNDSTTYNENNNTITISSTEGTTIIAKASVATQAEAIAAHSGSIVNITGPLYIEASTFDGQLGDAITTRGAATINIGQNGELVQIKGNIEFDYDKASSGTAVDAYTNISLNGEDSYWVGNTVTSWDTVPDESFLQVTEMQLKLSNGATWTPVAVQETRNTKYAPLPHLTLGNGVVNVNEDVSITIADISGAGTITNAGTMSLGSTGDGELGGTITNTGAMDITGTTTLASDSTYTQNGIGSLTVKDGATLTSKGTMVLNDGTLNVQGTVYFAEGSLLAVDGSKLTGSNAAVTLGSCASMAIDDNARLRINNATSGQTYQIVNANGDAAASWNIIESSSDMVLLTSDDGGKTFDATRANAEDVFGLDGEVGTIVNDLYTSRVDANGETVDDANPNSSYIGVRFLSRATDKNFLGSDKKAAASTIESAARIAFAGAVPQMTKMASDAATNAVVNRLGFANPDNGAKAMNADGKLVDDKALGLALWIAPLWSNQTGFGMEAGNLDYGYNANLGGVSLGADYTWANNIRAGLMFNIGGGYAESAGGDLSETTNSMTFWGVGAYGGWEYNNFAVMADVSYTSTWNSVDQDLDHRMQMSDLEADIQASAISAGLRFEYKLETQYLDLIPHVGVRYMSINTWGYDVDSSDGTVLEGDGFQQNIWTFPVGITFSKELEMNNDWYFKPSVDFTVIPAAGDIKAKQDVLFTGMQRSYELETQMMDYFTWQGGVGLEFGNDNMSVGVNYTLQAGQNSTGHGVFGMFRYEF